MALSENGLLSFYIILFQKLSSIAIVYLLIHSPRFGNPEGCVTPSYAQGRVECHS